MAATNSVVQYDERGKPYMLMQTGKRYYLSPMAMGEAAPEDSQGRGFAHGRPTWNQDEGEFERGLDLTFPLSLAAGAGIGAGALSSAGAFGAGGSASGLLPSTSTVSGMGSLAPGGAMSGLLSSSPTIGSSLLGGGMPTLASGATVPSIGSLAPALPSGASAGGSIASLLSRGSTLSDLLRGGAAALGGAGNAAEANRLTSNDALARANTSNIIGQGAYEDQLNARAKLESDQRGQALRDLYRSSYATNRQAGPFNTRGLTPLSPTYLSSLSDLEKQASTRLQAGPQYATDKMTPVKPYVPIVPNTSPGGVEKTANILGPALTIGGLIAGYRGR